MKKILLIINRKASIFTLFLIGLFFSVQSYALEVVKVETTETVDPVTFESTFTDSTVFDPDVLISPITTAIVTTICSVAGIFLIVIGCRWVFRLCRGGA